MLQCVAVQYVAVCGKHYTEIHRKITGNTTGKPQENHRKITGNTTGKPQENHRKITGNTGGKAQEKSQGISEENITSKIHRKNCRKVHRKDLRET